MIDAFPHGRPSRSSLVLLAVISGLATAVILGDAFGASPVRQAVLAAARARAQTGRREVLLAEAALRAAQSAPATSVSAGSSGGTGGAGGGASGGSGGGSGASSSPAAVSSPAPSNSTSSSPSPSPPSSPSSPTPTATPKATVSHLFEIVLSSSGYDTTFGSHAAMPYLRSLTAHATELSQYRSLGHGALADELALVSGQPPNQDTSGGCATYAEFPGTAPNAAGVVAADGCVYPETVLTLGDQVSSAGHTWRAFVTGMGSQACVHPNSNAADSTVLTGAGPTYDTRQNPFIYFHSLLDLGDCSTGDLDLGKLSGTLTTRAHAPAYVYVAPGACEQESSPPVPGDPTSSTTSSSTTSSSTTSSSATSSSATSSSATTTVSGATTTTSTSGPTSSSTGPGSAGVPGCPSGQPSGPAAQDTFLKTWVPKILASPVYRDRGALVIAFSSATAEAHPVRTGALILTAARTHRRVVATAVDPYALLRGTEIALGLTPLAKAKHASSAVAPLF